MKDIIKHLLLLTAIGLCGIVSAQEYTIKHLSWNGTKRQYIEYVPASYSPSQPTAVLFMLHGLGDSMQNAFARSGMQPLADEMGWIIITPQALMANVPLFGQTIPLGAMWNAGIQCQLGDVTLTPNSDVDDAGFLMALLDSTESLYNIHPDSVFCSGFSMGGFMSHRMAVEHGDRIKAIAAVSGTLASGMTGSAPKVPVRVLHIHGTADQVVSYDSSILSLAGLGNFSLGYGAEATVDYWRSHNHCDSTEYGADYADRKEDGLTFERRLYLGGDSGSYVVFIRVLNGTHSWYANDDSTDISYAKEIVAFLRGELPAQMGTSAAPDIACRLWPNPTTGPLTVQSPAAISHIQLYDMQGRLLLSQPCTDESTTINCTSLTPGVYCLRVQTPQGCAVQKIAVRR